MRTVQNILTRKGSNVITVEPTTAVLTALQIMADKNIGSVVVVKDGAFAGIMSERDYSRKIVLKGRSSEQTTVADIMSTDFPVVLPNDTITHCMQLLASKSIRYLPVIENKKLLGIISSNDVVAETILSQNEMIAHLQQYIQS